MNNHRYLLVAVLLCAGLVSSGWADTILLKGGCQVTADVLKEDEQAVVVDLGTVVIRFPRSEIVKITKAHDGKSDMPTTAPTSQPVDREAPGWRLFHNGGYQAATIEDNVQRIGESVVMVSTPNGLGSGFVITDDGYCITNYHVIAKETRLKVTVFRKTDTGYEQKHYKKAKIIGINPFVDLALLKIDTEGDTLKYAPLGKMETCEVGQEVFAIGNPLGLTRTVSQGIISTTNRNFEGQLYIQTTTAINPGNSGGPLFNLNGEVIGVTSMGYLFLGGLNFAIPVDVVKRFVINRDAFAHDEDNPNNGYRYLQPATRQNKMMPTRGKLPSADLSKGKASTEKPAERKDDS